MNKKFIAMIIILALNLNIIICNAQSTTQAETTILSSINISSGKVESIGEADTFIELGDTITISGVGATVDKNKVTITSAGTYSIKGSLTDGQIVVNAGDDDKVYIILNGVNISCSNSSPIYVMSSKKTVISLANNTKNYIEDGKEYIFEDESSDEPNAAIFSKEDLTFIGEGELFVKANYNNGITSKDDLKIENGDITVNSVGEGLRGKDSVVITGGNIVINSSQDGIKSNNDEDTDKGYVLIEGGKITITAEQDGIQGETNVLIKNSDITIKTGGGSTNSSTKKDDMGQWGKEDRGNQLPNGPNGSNTPPPSIPVTNDTSSEEEAVSAKAIKAGVNIIIESGNFDIDSSDDAIHSNNNLVINGGDFNISSGDDGMHADSNVTLNNGNINIKKSYEGIESETITINNGDINISASDDGINASDTGLININGGDVNVNADGDGIDANGSIYMTGGTVIVNGPTNDGNGALDYDGSFKITGGLLIAAGSSGMAQAPISSSTQNSVKITLSQQTANTIVHVESDDGKEILTFAPSKQYSSVVVSSSKFETGSKYKVYVGGSLNDETYTKGEEVGSFTVSSIISEITQEGVTSTNIGGPPSRPEKQDSIIFTDNQTVNTNKIWTITFSDDIVLDDTTKKGITVTDSKGLAVNIGIQLGQNNKTVIVTAPQGGYTVGEKYTLMVGKQVHSSKGIQLKKDTVLHFNIKNK